MDVGSYSHHEVACILALKPRRIERIRAAIIGDQRIHQNEVTSVDSSSRMNLPHVAASSVLEMQ